MRKKTTSILRNRQQIDDGLQPLYFVINWNARFCLVDTHKHADAVAGALRTYKFPSTKRGAMHASSLVRCRRLKVMPNIELYIK